MYTVPAGCMLAKYTSPIYAVHGLHTRNASCYSQGRTHLGTIIE